MKTILRKVILVLGLALGLQTSVKAQLVFIPDSGFRAALNQYYAGCMVGDSIDPTCPAVINAASLDVSYRGIIDLTGLEFFTNLTFLRCNNNYLNILPPLPDSLKLFYCDKNQISILPAMPPALSRLYCNDNQLASLPALPNTLKTLFCQNNLLTSMPSLPASLEEIRCFNNQLTSLPTLPVPLQQLYCQNNQLASLPTLNNSLKLLHCNNNQLTSLPLLPASMNSVYTDDNQLTSLPILPIALNSLHCRGNQLTNLPQLPNTLQYLYCGSNQLTSLQQPLPNRIIYFSCSNNSISNLPTLPDSLTYFYCDSNPISCLPDLKKVEVITFTNTLINCLPSYGQITYSSPSLSSVPLCDLFNSNGCEVLWNIEGSIYVDVNANCIKGNNEPGLGNQKVKLYKNGVVNQITYSNYNGNYSFSNTPFDIYKTEFDTTGSPFGVICPNSVFYTDTISFNDQQKYDRDFALKCNQSDLAATSIYTEDIRPARVIEVSVQAGDLPNFYGLSCAAGVCGTVSITITGDCSYFSSPSYALTPTSVVGNVLTYSIADFGTISYDSTFDFNLLVDTTASLGSQICITVSVFTKCVQEINFTNNQITQCFTVVGSFDPNDKAVSPTTTMDLSGNRWLTYTIRFQNTGTASAEHILITDTISADLMLSTFTLLSSSHEPKVDLKLDNDRVIKFQFPFINLPDSNTNEPASNGYVQFKIKAKDSLTIGNAIENKANIYFDFNAPVITNTTSNTIINCNIPTTNLSATLCNGDVYSLNGMEYYSTGIYKQNLLTAFGCDSTVRLNLTVNKSTITRSNDTLQATTLNAISYQWINCTTGSAIVGANTQTYNPTQSGSYAVVVDFGTCQDTSACFYFSPVGINEINASNIIIQPNPFNNELKILLDKNYQGVLEVYNTLGALITSEKLQSRNATLNTSTWNSGVYILKVATNDGVVVKKVVKR